MMAATTIQEMRMNKEQPYFHGPVNFKSPKGTPRENPNDDKFEYVGKLVIELRAPGNKNQINEALRILHDRIDSTDGGAVDDMENSLDKQAPYSTLKVCPARLVKIGKDMPVKE